MEKTTLGIFFSLVNVLNAHFIKHSNHAQSVSFMPITINYFIKNFNMESCFFLHFFSISIMRSSFLWLSKQTKEI